MWIKQKFLEDLHDINPNQFCLGNVSKDFWINGTKEITSNVTVYDFLIDHWVIDVKDIYLIHRYLIKKRNITRYLHLLNQCFCSIKFRETIYSHTFTVTQNVKCISLDKELCLKRRTEEWDELYLE